MVVDKAPRSSGCHVQRFHGATMVDELSEYFSKDLIAIYDLRKDDIASISWQLLLARVRVANRAISIRIPAAIALARMPQRWAPWPASSRLPKKGCPGRFTIWTSTVSGTELKRRIG